MKEQQLIFPKIEEAHFENTYTDKLSSEEYHSMHDFLSSSALCDFMVSPENYLYKLRERQTKKKKDSDAFRFGKIAHMMFLEPEVFKKRYVREPNFGDQRSTKNKEEKNLWYLNLPKDAVVCSDKDMDILIGMEKTISAHPIAKGMLKTGIPEVSFFARCPRTGILLKVRPDFIDEAYEYFLDYKTCQDARPDEFAKDVFNFNYDVRMFMYQYVINLVLKRLIHPTFIASQKPAPQSTAVYPIGMMTLAAGEQAFFDALIRFKKCLVTNNWPGFQTEATPIEMPEWALRKRGIEL